VSWNALAESIHGHAGILAVAVLVHPAVLLWRGRPLSRGARWAIAASSIATSLAFGLGISIYEAYRETIKRSLYIEAPQAGWLFETKEHLAFAVIALALGAAACALLSPREHAELRRLAAWLFACAAALGAVVAAIGVYVASVRGFP
jgi:hypothetical protein